MEITLSKEQLEQIYHYDKTKSVTTACNLARTLVEAVLAKEAVEVISE